MRNYSEQELLTLVISGLRLYVIFANHFIGDEVHQFLSINFDTYLELCFRIIRLQQHFYFRWCYHEVMKFITKSKR